MIWTIKGAVYHDHMQVIPFDEAKVLKIANEGVVAFRNGARRQPDLYNVPALTGEAALRLDLLHRFKKVWGMRE